MFATVSSRLPHSYLFSSFSFLRLAPGRPQAGIGKRHDHGVNDASPVPQCLWGRGGFLFKAKRERGIAAD